MAREFSRAFYHSDQWEATRNAYFASKQGLCERCLAEGKYTPGEIVHHKVHLSPDNINDPTITLSFDNLELVCRKCHALEHPEIYGTDESQLLVEFDEYGNVIGRKHED